MDEAAVREHAAAHGAAVVDGDLRKASGDLTEEARGQAGDVMRQIPDPLAGAEVTDIRFEGEDAVATIVYSGGDSSVTVESTWSEREGRPMIVDLSIP